uniref:RRM domain-containing protein n=1 Tax=Dendroctonus ponderosae TaxID=77166 RepID=A0AAR5Q4J2_DENPD
MEGYCYETSARRRAVHNPIKYTGFRPERAAEIFVSNIPAKASILDLLCFFQQTGDLFQATLVMKYKSELNRGYAFITYLDKNGAQRAFTELRNQPFINPATLLTIKQSTNNRRIFIGGVPIEKSKDKIWQELLAAYRVQNIVDVITYRNHTNPLYNRGFVFLEFRTHDEAAQFRDKFQDRLRLFGKKVLVDWSVPAAGQGQEQRQKPSAGVPEKVKILFLRNLDVTEPPEDFTRFIYDLIDRSLVDKVYKFKDYAYIHLSTRYNAEKLLASLQAYYKGTMVEISFAKPPNGLSGRCFRNQDLTLKGQVVEAARKPGNFHQRHPQTKAKSKQEKSVDAAQTVTVPPIGQFIAPPTVSNIWWYPAANEYQQLKPDVVSGQSHECSYWPSPTGATPSMYSSPASLDCFNLEDLVDSILA